MSSNNFPKQDMKAFQNEIERLKEKMRHELEKQIIYNGAMILPKGIGLLPKGIGLPDHPAYPDRIYSSILGKYIDPKTGEPINE